MKKLLVLTFSLLLAGICAADEHSSCGTTDLLPHTGLSLYQSDFTSKCLELTTVIDDLTVKPNSCASTIESSTPQLVKTADGTPVSTIGTQPDQSKLESIVNPVEKILTIYTGRIKDRYKTYLELSTKYVGLMKQILRDRGVPEDVAYLSLVESGFNPHACSKAKAVGQWQFIEETAKRYGLHIDFWRDERKDPVRATQAASDYLKDLYNRFGSWELAMAAYNVGENRIQRLVSRDNLKGYLDVSQSDSLPDETKKYFPGYLATLRIVANPEQFGFTDLKYEQPIDYDEVVITSPATIEAIAKATGSTVKEIKDLNPELKQWCTPLNTNEYLLRVPRGTADYFAEQLSRTDIKGSDIIRQYTVRKNDTVKRISKSTGVPEGTIVAMNPGLIMKAGNNVMLPPKNVLVMHSQLKTVKIARIVMKKYASRKTAKSDRDKKLYAAKSHRAKRYHT